MNDLPRHKCYPIVIFIILTFVLSLPMLLLRFMILPFEPMLIYASWTPNIAAFIVIGLVLREKGGIRKLLSGWGKWKVGFRWYLVALSPFLISFLTAGIYILISGGRPMPVGLMMMPLVMSLFISLITGAMGEELGWRGFLLPRIQERYNATISSIIVGVIWSLWHLPLWSLPGYGWNATPYWGFALTTISISVIMTWVLNNTNGSLVMASLIHLTMNFSLSVVGMLGLIPSPGTFWSIIPILYAFYALLVIWITGPENLTGRSQTGG
jgi:membrane protease YdiL (CAAX protease family)